MTDQQGSKQRDEMDPYPADQQFGAQAARDQERADEMVDTDGEDDAAGTADTPRAGNKAEPA